MRLASNFFRRCSFISSFSSMESVNWGPGSETLEGLGGLTSFSGKSENWTRLLVRKMKERLKWQLGEEDEEHLYEDLEEELHPDVKIYFAYLQRYC